MGSLWVLGCVGRGAVGREGAGADGCCPPGKPTLYGSVTRRGLSSDGVPDIAASEGFVVGEVTKVPGLGGEELVTTPGHKGEPL